MADGKSSMDITPLGFHNFRGNKEQKFGVKIDDRRRHVYVIGKTGVGKSTLLENMAIADIQSGKGIAFIDPHGESAEKLLDFIPEERLDDVIYFDPSDMEHPIAFNPMEQVGNEFRHLVASGIMGVFKKIWPDAWSARMEYILNNTLLSLLELPGSTLLGILRMFAEPNYRKKIVDNLQDPVIKAFWQNEFARYTQRLESEALAAIQNKVGQFVSNPLIRNILGQSRSTLNMREIMDSGKIFIANLSKGKMGEDNSALLGAMIISRLQLAAMSRVDMPEDKRRDFFMYVDEFQNFATESFASILSEARKYHLSITLANQYIGQLVTSDGNAKVRDAVFGNVGTLITFRVGAADAEFLEKEFMPEFIQQDLVNLAKANIYIKLMIDGVSSRPFSATTLPPSKMPLVSHKDIIIKNSQEHYGTPRKVVEERIASEWNSDSNAAIDEKIVRRDERRLSDVLKSSPRASSGGASANNRPLGQAGFQGKQIDARSPSQQPGKPPLSASTTAKPTAAMDRSVADLTAGTTGKDAKQEDIKLDNKSDGGSDLNVGSATKSGSEEKPVEKYIDLDIPEDEDTDIKKAEDPSEAEDAAEPEAPATPSEKHFPRANVNVEALRQSIKESLKKQQESQPAQNVSQPSPVKPPAASVPAQSKAPVAPPEPYQVKVQPQPRPHVQASPVNQPQSQPQSQMQTQSQSRPQQKPGSTRQDGQFTQRTADRSMSRTNQETISLSALNQRPEIKKENRSQFRAAGPSVRPSPKLGDHENDLGKDKKAA